MKCEMLLQRYAEKRDADAFRELVRRYSDMVYTTCLRVTGNPHDAEDAAQTCFLSLARNAATIESNLLGWLHATARNASLALVKKSNKHKEGRAAMARAKESQAEPAWKDLEGHIDAAIQELPEDLQPTVMLYYLQDKTQAEIAEICGVDQSTVSRRLERGVEALRKRLKTVGIVVPAAVLMSMLGQSTLQAAPSTLTATLGKMALAGIGKATGATATSTAASSFLGTVSGKVTVVVTAAAVATACFVLQRHLARTADAPVVRQLSEGEPAPPAPAQETPMPKKYPEVILGDVVKAFNDLIARHNEGHVVGAGDEVYQQPSVYLSFHLIQMRAEGWKEMDFDTVASVSGSSALFAYDPKDMMPKYANLHIGVDRRIAEATGFGYEWMGFEGAEGAWDVIRDAIDDGHALKGWDWENVLFAGYQDAAKGADRKVFVCADGPGTYAKWWTWKEFTDWVTRVQEWGQCRFGRYAERVETKPEKEVALRVMKDLVDWSTEPPDVVESQYPNATFGLAAMEAFAGDVADVTKKQKEFFKETAWCACHASNPQWIVRNSTGIYLERLAAANALSKGVDDHLLAAATEYRAAYTDWQEFYRQLGHKAPKDAWEDAARRTAGAAAIRRALEHERAALAEVKSALIAAGVGMVRIDGVENFENTQTGLSHLRALACVLRHHGEKVKWDWLMGASGEAFCYYYHPDGTYLSQFVHSWDVANAALGAYGYEGTWRFEPGPGVPPALEAIRSELTAGRPVIAPGILPAPNGINSRCNFWFVVTGIDVDARKVRLVGGGEAELETSLPVGDDVSGKAFHPRWYGIVRSFDGIDGHYGPKRADNPVLIVAKSKRTAKAEDIVLASLRRAVRLARHDTATSTFGWGAGTYLGGIAAMQRLHDDLLAAKGDGLEEYTTLNRPKGDPFRGLGDELEFLKLLSRRRRSAATFVEQCAPVLQATARPHLSAAAKHFRDSAAEAMQAFNIRYTNEDAHARMSRLIGENENFEEHPEWVAYCKHADEALASQENRRMMAARLTRVIASERAAVREIERALMADSVKREDGKVWIEALKQRPAWMTHMGCLMGSAECLGVDASPAWIYGGSGYAFALNIDEVICPSGPTAWPAEKCEALAANVGINTERFQGPKSREDVDAFRETIWERTREAIDAGLPAYGWEMGIPEWYVVHGYDGEGNYLYRDFGDKTGKRHHTKLGDTDIGWICMALATKGEAADDRAVVRDAFLFALEHGAGKHSKELWHTGLSGYDTWIKALEDEEALKGDVIGFGCAYNAQCWAECRRNAVAFLEEAKERLDDEQLSPLFDDAIEHYATVRDRLSAVAKMFPFKVGDEKGMNERMQDADRRKRAVGALRVTRDAEEAGLRALAKIADALKPTAEAP